MSDTIADHRRELAAGFDQAIRIAAGVRAEQLLLPTPCTDFDVAALLHHLVVAGSHALPDSGSVTPADVAPEAVPAELARLRDAAAAAWSDARLHEEITVPWGETYSGSTLVAFYAIELVTHAIDLAVATGQRDALDETLAASVLPLAEAHIQPAHRGPQMPFGPIVPAPAGARASEALAAFMGRTFP